jgi:Cu2+-exporting ATPase
MLMIDTLIILGFYTSFRLRERYKNKSKPVEQSSLMVLDEPKKQQHYVRVSSNTIILSLLSAFYPPLRIINFAVITYSIFPILRRAEYSLVKEHTLKNDALSAVVSIISLGLGVQLAAAIQNFVYHLGRQMVAQSKDLSTQTLSAVFNQQSTQVWVVREQIEIQIELENLQMDDIVVVKTGEIIPVDGVIIKGCATVDQQALTGESIPVEKELADDVFAATLIISGELYIHVEKTGADTTIAQLAEILTNTTDFKTTLQLKGEYWANKSSLPLITASVISIPFLGLTSATTLLFSSPTNTIQVMTSMQTSNYMTLIACHSILIKDGRALESLGKIDVVLFDKTGTLTEAHPVVAHIQSFSTLTEDQILTYAAAAEIRLTHPIAKAIINEAQKRGLQLPEVEEAYYKMGHGIVVQLDGNLIQVGSHRFMQKENINVPNNSNLSAIFIAINGHMVGCIELQANIRDEIPQVIGLLRQQGIKKIIIVSGDHHQPTKNLAEKLGIDEYFYETLPEEKAVIVEQLQQQGHRVCFIGDGINDTLAMQKADVSISLAGAASIATDMAQIVFLDGNLYHLNKLFEIAKRLNSGLKNSLLFWATYGAGNIALTILFPLGLMTSSLLFASFFTLGLGHAILPLALLEPKNLKDQKKLPHSTEEEKF